MKSLRIASCLIAILALSSKSAAVPSIVIAGSELIAPPAYWDDSYYPLASSIDRAFPFKVIPGGPYLVDELQVAAFHSKGLAGRSATFSLHEDSHGVPGDFVVDFQIHHLSTVRQIHTSAPTGTTILHSGVPYWIVGQSQLGQVNWNLGAEAFGQTAFRRPDMPWTIQEDRNVSAFAVLGRRVPELSSITLFGVAVFGLFCFRTRP